MCPNVTSEGVWPVRSTNCGQLVGGIHGEFNGIDVVNGDSKIWSKLRGPRFQVLTHSAA